MIASNEVQKNCISKTLVSNLLHIYIRGSRPGLGFPQNAWLWHWLIFLDHVLFWNSENIRVKWKVCNLGSALCMNVLISINVLIIYLCFQINVIMVHASKTLISSKLHGFSKLSWLCFTIRFHCQSRFSLIQSPFVKLVQFAKFGNTSDP